MWRPGSGTAFFQKGANKNKSEFPQQMHFYITTILSITWTLQCHIWQNNADFISRCIFLVNTFLLLAPNSLLIEHIMVRKSHSWSAYVRVMACIVHFLSRMAALNVKKRGGFQLYSVVLLKLRFLNDQMRFMRSNRTSRRVQTAGFPNRMENVDAFIIPRFSCLGTLDETSKALPIWVC